MLIDIAKNEKKQPEFVLHLTEAELPVLLECLTVSLEISADRLNMIVIDCRNDPKEEKLVFMEKAKNAMVCVRDMRDQLQGVCA